MWMIRSLLLCVIVSLLATTVKSTDQNNTKPLCTEGDIKFKEATSPPAVMMCTRGEWAYICVKNGTWSPKEVALVCYQLGQTVDEQEERTATSISANGNEFIIFSSGCSFPEKRLYDCNYHYIDPNNRCEIIKNQNYSDEYSVASAVCNNSSNVSCSTGNVTDEEGSLLICVKGEWHTLCADQNMWSVADARVACRQLGLNPNGAGVKNVSLSQGYNTLSIMFGCNGEEEKLSYCSLEEMNECTINQTVAGLSCGGANITTSESTFVRAATTESSPSVIGDNITASESTVVRAAATTRSSNSASSVIDMCQYYLVLVFWSCSSFSSFPSVHWSVLLDVGYVIGVTVVIIIV